MTIVVGNLQFLGRIARRLNGAYVHEDETSTPTTPPIRPFYMYPSGTRDILLGRSLNGTRDNSFVRDFRLIPQDGAAKVAQMYTATYI